MSKKYVLDCEQSNYSSSSHYLIEPEMAPFDLWPKNPTYRPITKHEVDRVQKWQK